MEEPKYERPYAISGIFPTANLNFWANVAKLVGLLLSCALAVTPDEVAFLTPSNARSDELALLVGSPYRPFRVFNTYTKSHTVLKC